jgi:hypothetical protein
MYGHQDLHWKDSRLYLGSCATGNSITPDIKYPSMWRVRYPDGSLSDIVNLTRARDGARCLALAVLNTRETRVAASPIAQNAQGGEPARLRSRSLSPQSAHTPGTRSSPKVLKPSRRQLGVAHGVLDLLVTQVGLQRPGIRPLVRQREAAGMPQHVGMGLECQPGGDACALKHAGVISTDRRNTF